jgi:hypothetical protein
MCDKKFLAKTKHPRPYWSGVFKLSVFLLDVRHRMNFSRVLPAFLNMIITPLFE